jgi:hypothetical protein
MTNSHNVELTSVSVLTAGGSSFTVSYLAGSKKVDYWPAEIAAERASELF